MSFAIVKPLPEQYGYVKSEGFDGEASGWTIEGGQDAYEKALHEWEILNTL